MSRSMIEKLDPRIKNAIILYNNQPIDASDKMSVIIECIEQLLSASGEKQPSSQKGTHSNGNIGENQE